MSQWKRCIFERGKICLLSSQYGSEELLDKMCLPCRSGKSLEMGVFVWIAVVLSIELLLALITLGAAI